VVFCGFALPAATPAPANSVNAETTTVATPAPKAPPGSSQRFFGADLIFRPPFLFGLRGAKFPVQRVEKRLSKNAYNP
jgi:hypothetical protein